MPTALSVTAPLLLAAVLVVSAIGKLRSPERSRAAFTAMGLPAWLDRPGLARAHPWGEIVLAVLMLLAPAPVGVVVAVAALLLMLVYVGLVVRALRSPVDVDCACFGALGGERVTAATVWRNVWLSVLAGASVASAVSGPSVVSRLVTLDASSMWWLSSVLAGVVTTALVLISGRGPEIVESNSPGSDDVDHGEYVRTRTPAIPITLADGATVDLRRLSQQRAQLLVYVSEICGSCQGVIAAVPKWRTELPQIDVRIVVAGPPNVSWLASTDEPLSVHDQARYLWETFGLGGTPAALLLGTDGLLAGGPAVGSDAVRDLVNEVREQLAG